MEDIKKSEVNVAEELAKEEKQTDATEQKEDKAEQGKAPDFDYEKLASLVNGRQSATEDSVLKGYFKQQGLSADEMAQAIATFKSQKAQNAPDVNAIQAQATESLKRALHAEAQSQAMLLATEIGIDVKAMPYLVRMLNMNDITESGEVDKTKLKSGLEDIVNAMPQLKQTTVQGGFQKVGADTTQNAQSADDEALERAFGIRK